MYLLVVPAQANVELQIPGNTKVILYIEALDVGGEEIAAGSIKVSADVGRRTNKERIGAELCGRQSCVCGGADESSRCDTGSNQGIDAICQSADWAYDCAALNSANPESVTDVESVVNNTRAEIT